MTEKPLALVVDDDLSLGEMFGMAFELAGFDTEVIHDGRLTIERMSARKPALVSLDMQMPHMTGAEVLRQIRADARFKGVKVMMITANGRAAEEATVRELADIILIKPVTLSQIKEFATRLTHGKKED
ncbi:MAG: response regulator [Chloroflexota bacterium]